jgi:uncharacterized protein YbbC (DUF1343 family)
MIPFGVDTLLESKNKFSGKKIALVTNHAATTHAGVPSRKALIAGDYNIVKLFSPEHGLNVRGADGAKLLDNIDALTNLPVISLYGNKMAPSKEDLSDVDVVFFDIPDIGCRYYTYLWTMTLVMEACAKYKKPMVILDRPNPLSGIPNLAEGPMLNEKRCSSFIGRWNIPLKHNCTLGELAHYFNANRKLHLDLTVILCSEWKRNMFQPDWEIPFVQTSPAIKSFEQAMLYPGLGLLEATNISEGRGTELPFKLIGAPWLDAEKVIAKLLPTFEHTLTLKQKFFTPIENKYNCELCNGIECTVTDFRKFTPVLFGMLLIKYIKDLHPEHFKYANYPTNANPSGKNHMDKLSGMYQCEKFFALPFYEFETLLGTNMNVDDWEKKMFPHRLYE